ncbi:MAG: glycosyltransferase [Tannerellaceae bacterium]|nr:glycosyltransferase [Tannerellaceae bacterium]
MSPRFSIITVTYNASLWIEKTILSVLNQSYSDIEYIIIDGKSKDQTIDIIKKYEKKIAYWISEVDQGLYDAMNKGLKVATGDYVWFINAGDTLSSTDIIQKLILSLNSKKQLPDIIYGETKIVNQSGHALGLRRLKAPDRLTWKSFRMGMLVCHQSFIPKREIAPLYNTIYTLSADYDWCIQCLLNAKTIYNSHLILSDFLEEGMSSVHRRKSLKERFDIMCKYYGKSVTIMLHGWFVIRFYFAKYIKGRV